MLSDFDGDCRAAAAKSNDQVFARQIHHHTVNFYNTVDACNCQTPQQIQLGNFHKTLAKIANLTNEFNELNESIERLIERLDEIRRYDGRHVARIFGRG